MLTYQDFEGNANRAEFIAQLIAEHEASELVRTAREADEYDAQRNTLIRNFVQKIYSASGLPIENTVASNNKRASNFFRRLNVQRCTYSLGNGVTFENEGTKARLGEATFDTRLKQAAYRALIHGVCFLFYTVDRVHVFPVTEFAPMYDEDTGALRAGVRYWCIGKGKPTTAVLYEEDGYTVYRKEDADYAVLEEKRGYRRTVSIAPADDVPEIVGEENYGALPIVPLWGSELHQSTLIGLKDGIDNYDLISNGWCNDIRDCAQIYWLLENYGGMTPNDLANFRAQLLYQHIANADTTSGGKVTAYTQDVPYAARQAYLEMLRRDMYADFGALDVSSISASAKTATEINAAYQPLDESADDFEYQIIECVQQLTRLAGQEDTPRFKRNRISNQTEQVEMIMMEANYLDDQTVLELLPNITPEQVDKIMERRDANDLTGEKDMEAADDAMGAGDDAEA